MPTLIVDQPNRRFGGRITGRVLIGRLPTNGVALTDSSVSRLHAWLAPNGHGNYFVADTGSLTGTWVNGAAIVRRRDLADGDVIKVGHTEMKYSTSNDLPFDIERVNLAGLPPVENVEEAGVLFDCPCGAPAWFKSTAIGHTHQCRQCGRTVLIPGHSNQIATEVSPPSIGEPGVPPVARPAAPALDPSNPMLLHDPNVPDTHPQIDEHGLADSGIHSAIREAEKPASPAAAAPDELSVDDLFTPGTELEPTADAPLETLLDEGQATELQAAAASPSEIESASEAAEEVFDLGASETPGAEAVTCSVCRTAINPGDAQTVCPSCGLTFHADCWKENLGCSAYGCPQVNVLAPPAEESHPVEVAVPNNADVPTIEPEEPAGFPWEFMFLFVCVIGTLLGALSYGVPAVIGLLGTMLYIMLFQDSRRRRPVAWAAPVLCVVGIAVGVYVSYIYWKGWPPIGPWARSAAAATHASTGIKR